MDRKLIVYVDDNMNDHKLFQVEAQKLTLPLYYDIHHVHTSVEFPYVIEYLMKFEGRSPTFVFMDFALLIDGIKLIKDSMKFLKESRVFFLTNFDRPYILGKIKGEKIVCEGVIEKRNLRTALVKLFSSRKS